MILMSRRGSMAPVLCFILLTLSIGLNILFIRNRPTTYKRELIQGAANGQQTVYLREVATAIGLNPSQILSDGDLASDIHIALSEARVDVVRPIPPDVIKSIEEVLGPADVASIQRLNDFVESLKGKRLLALPTAR